MSNSGLKHADVGDELSKAEWLSEESHELVHGTSFPGSPTERQLFYRDDEHKWYIRTDSAWVELTAGGGAPPAHASTHENGGSDEISVAGLSGLLADGQTPLAHKASHQNGGSDELNVDGLSGELADPQKSNFLKLSDTPSSYSGQSGKVAKVKATEDGLEFGEGGGGASTFLGLTDTPSSYSGQAGKYAKVNSGESALEFDTPGGGGDMLKSVYDTDEDGVVDNSEKLEGSTKAQVQNHSPQAHKASHQDGGADEISVAGLSGLLATPQTPATHKTSHQDGGADEISVAGLSGLLADDQHVLDSEVLAVAAALSHKTQHQNGGADEISIEGLAGSPAQKAQASGLASLNASSKVAQQPASVTDHLEDTPSDGETTKAPTSNWAYDHAADKSAHHSNIATLTFVIDGGGSPITTGQKGHLYIPFNCIITQVTLLADQTGSIVIDIWKDGYGFFPPTDADSITSSTPPTISSAQKSQDSTLSGWTTYIYANDVLAFNVDSCSSITRVTLSLRVEKS